MFPLLFDIQANTVYKKNVPWKCIKRANMREPSPLTSFHEQRFLRGTVRLRFNKSISRQNFQNTRKFENNDFQYHSDVIYSV